MPRWKGSDEMDETINDFDYILPRNSKLLLYGNYHTLYKEPNGTFSLWQRYGEEEYCEWRGIKSLRRAKNLFYHREGMVGDVMSRIEEAVGEGIDWEGDVGYKGRRG